MVLRTVKILILLMALVLFVSHAYADESELVISVNEEGNLYAQSLFDDDGSIGFVEICILKISRVFTGGTKETISECHKFKNVIEDQVFEIAVQEQFAVGLDSEPQNFTPNQVHSVTLAQTNELQNVSLAGTEISPFCNDGFCGVDETCENCSADCGVCPDYCGDGVCGLHYGTVETCGNCANDCGACFCGNGTCDYTNSEDCFNCAGDCPTCPRSDFAAAYYNFVDLDGTITGSKFLLFASNPTFAPALSTVAEIETENIVLSKTLTPTVTEDKKEFFVEAKLKINPESGPIENVLYNWKINEATIGVTQEMVEEEDSWVLNIGPFSEPITLESSVLIELEIGPNHSEKFSPRFFHLVLPDESGSCSSVTFSPPKKTATNFNNNFSGIFLQEEQPGWAQSVARVKLAQDLQDPDLFKVKKISDETIGSLNDVSGSSDDIDFLNIFIITDIGIEQHAFTDIVEGDRLELTDESLVFKEEKAPPSASFVEIPNQGTQNSAQDPQSREIFYNFMDSDFGVGNMNLLLPLNPEDIVDTPDLLPIDRASFIENVEMEVVPSEDCTSFNIKFKTTVSNEEEIERVYLKYGFDNYSLREQSASHEGASLNIGFEKPENNRSEEFVLELQGDGGEFEGELGPFSSVFDFFSRIYAEGSSGESSSFQNFFSWFGLGGLIESQEKTEICGNRVDDNGDGNIDEGCVILPDLMFVGQEKIPSFVRVGNPINVFATIKNVGVSNTASFEVSFFMNDELIEVAKFSGLTAEEEAKIGFLVSDSTPFLGINRAKIVIDPTNEVPELNIVNNELSQDLAVGFNTFNIVLNFNKANILGDTREFRAFNRESGEPEKSAVTIITYPSGKVEEFLTADDGTNDFKLTESGVYFLTASKENFETFQAAFTVLKIKLVNLLSRYDIGSTVSFAIETSDGEKVRDALVEIKDPNNQITVLKLDADAATEFQTKIGGKHEITVSRKGVQLFKENFLASGLVESIFIAGSFEELLFGSIVRDTPLFFILLLFALGGAIVAFSRSKLLFKPGPKSTRKQQLENVAKMFIAIVFFILPFQVTNHLAFNGGLATVVLEVFLVFLFEYYEKKIKRRRKAIKV